MITDIEIKSRSVFAGGAAFGDAGTFERIDGVATGKLHPAHPRNQQIALLDQTPADAEGMVTYRSDFVLLRPQRWNGRLLYEVNNRGRIMIFANLCAGAAGNQPNTAADLGNALPLRMGYAMLWSGWDAGAPKSTGLSLDVPIVEGLTQPIREEFVSGTRLGVHEAFKLSFEAVGAATVTVRRTQTGLRTKVDAVMADNRTVRPSGTVEAGSIYEVRYTATKPRAMGVGFAATRDLISYLRQPGQDMLEAAPSATLAFGISQAGRYLRELLAQGFNTDEAGGRVFDGIFTHVAGNGRVFLNAPFAQPFRTRTWHEDHDFPEVAFPHAYSVTSDPLTGATASLVPDDGAPPKIIQTNTSTEYWQKGASLLHTDPLGTQDVADPDHVRTYLISGSQHGGKAGMPRDCGPCINPRNWHDPMPAVRALFVAMDRWLAVDQAPPAGQVPSIRDKTLVPAGDVAFPAIPGLVRPQRANDAAPLADWINPVQAESGWAVLVPQVDADGNEIGGIRLPDVAVPRGTFTGWNLYKSPYPEGELADRDGTFLAFARTSDDRGKDPRKSIQERYFGRTYAEAVRTCVAELVANRLLLQEDADRYLAALDDVSLNTVLDC